MPLHMMAEVDISLKISRAIVAFFAFKTLSYGYPRTLRGGWSPLWHPLSGSKKSFPIFPRLAASFLCYRTFLAAENTGLDMADEKMNNMANSAPVSGYCGMGKSDVNTLGFTTERLYYAATRGFTAKWIPGEKKAKKKKQGCPPLRQIEPPH